MTTNLSLRETKREWHGSLKAYLIGFLISLLLTSASFFLVIAQLISGKVLIYTLMGLAVAQAVMQALFFLHVGQEAKPRWETLMFGFTILVLLIIVIGSLWIMHDLDMRVMSNMSMPHD